LQRELDELVKELLDKISSYNLFNYLFPGILFVVILGKFTHYSLVQENLVLGVFVYYFVGLIISRVGSLVVEPLLKKLSFLVFADYAEFVKASRVDAKIEVLSELNNMYRALVAMLLSLVAVKVYEALALRFQIGDRASITILTLVLLFMFLFAYRKQTEYIRKRIKAANP
jgi:uncharacterized membrane protein YraQ (UPF0718 family)